ncbi:NAD(P)/FAD-dependent oxidoreductase [Lichenihabitans psoromatis]|uniref:NAD(P)/FAD-dependent oxidoreductase n=1 Tax=Lichenihabitans psoromatis TaxID=2528642 RepID=UPI001036AA84|nr:FAD-dependent oxidoreductase [Lichenihabitans psoromatis]
MNNDVKSLDLAVIGTGISGMSAAWLLSKRHRVTVYEQAGRIGGHSNTISVAGARGVLPVDSGFIVYNDFAYPNLTALFAHLDVPTKFSDMSFAVSLDAGRLEYNGTDVKGLFAQRRNILSLRFWSMLRDLHRFYREAPAHAGKLGLTSLGDYLQQGRYGRAFMDDHLLPMAAAIWSVPAKALLDYPAEAFIRFCENHCLLRISQRPLWRTVEGGSRVYVERLTAAYADRIRLGTAARQVIREPGGATVVDSHGARDRFDHVVIATHADQALALLDDANAAERAALSPFRYSDNLGVMHRDPTLMPKRRAVWSSWNYLGGRQKAADADHLCVTYWMNQLQGLPSDDDIFVTLNPPRDPAPGTEIRRELYHHPMFDGAAMTAQHHLWSLQGTRNTWFCGAYFGAGFHEDGLQAGLAVAEQLGGVRRPWTVANESGRIVLGQPALVATAA